MITLISFQKLDYRASTYATPSFPLDFDRNLRPMDHWLHLFHNFQPLVDQFVENLINQSSDHDDVIPNIMLTDTIYAWSPSIARKYKLICVSFWTEPALVFSLLYHVDLLRQNGHFLSTGEKELETVDYVPGVKAMSTKHLMTSLTNPDDKSGLTLFAAFEEVKIEAW